MVDKLWTAYLELLGVAEEYEVSKGYSLKSHESFQKTLMDVLDLIEVVREEK